MSAKKQTRDLTRKEVDTMLGHLPTNDTDLLELMLDVLMRATTDYPEINLGKLTDALLDLNEGFETGDKNTTAFMKAQRFVQKTKLGYYILDSFSELYE